jgi:hypothetical protein
VFEGAQFIKQTANRPNVTLFVIRFLFAKLWRKVEWSANHCVSEVICIQRLCHTQITNFDSFIFVQKDVQCFDVSVKDFVPMNVLQTHANFNKELPNSVLFEVFFVLLFQVKAEIATVAELHQNVQIVTLDEGVLVGNNEGMLQSTHYMSLIDCLNTSLVYVFSRFLIHFRQRNLFQHTDCLIDSVQYFIDDSIAARTEFLPYFVVSKTIAAHPV